MGVGCVSETERTIEEKPATSAERGGPFITALKEIVAEQERILRAAADGRLHINAAGRYVIDGDRKRPKRRVREAMIQAGEITWPRRDTHCCEITALGREILERAERTEAA